MFEIFAEILVICGFFWRSLMILWICLEGFRDFVVFFCRVFVILWIVLEISSDFVDFSGDL